MRYAYKIVVRKLEGKRSFGRPRCRWEDNIRMDHMVMGWESVDCMHLGPMTALVNTVMNLGVP
jgi:hypothetical protein